MNDLQSLATLVAIVVSTLGIVGGLLTLPDTIRKYRRSRQPHGSKGVGFCILSRVDTSECITVRFLVTDDVFQFVTNLIQENTGGMVLDVQSVGEYYTATIVYPPGTDLTYRVTKRR